MTISDEEYNAMLTELSIKLSSRNRLQGEVEELQSQISEAENTRRNLPTEPGMYWHPEEKWPALLSNDGRWTDGWGTEFEDWYDLESVKRVEFVDD